MRKAKILLIISTLFLMCSCGKNTKNDIIENFNKKVENSKSYAIDGKMEIMSNEETYTYDVKVDYKYNENYKVTLKNNINNHTQVILKNKDGVYVVTPALNKSFKFQSDWPNNSSQSYLLGAINKDIKNTKEPIIDENKDYYIVNAKVNYSNNKNLIKEKIYFDKKGNIKEVQVLNKDGLSIIRMKFIKITYSKKFKENNFNLDTLVKNNECKDNECVNDKGNDEEVGNIDDVIYPLYLPSETHLSTKDKVETDNGERIIMTYSGAKPFMLIEEAVSASKEMEITNIFGNPLQLSTSVGALGKNSLEWQNKNMQYYITSTYLNDEELMAIAESLNTASVVEIKAK